MRFFRIIPLEERIVLDAALAGVVAGGEGEAAVSDAEVVEETVVAEAADASPAEAEAVEVNNDEPHVLLVPTDVYDYGALAGAAADDVVVVTYEPTQSLKSVLTQIEDALEGRLATTIGFANHGSADGFSLVDGVDVSFDSISDPSLVSFWQRLGEFITADGRIDLLACNLALTQDGQLLISQIESITGRNVAASTDLTANPDSGGDWVLETDAVDSASVYFDADALSEWDGILLNTPVATVDLAALGLAEPATDMIAHEGMLYFIANDVINNRDVVVQSDGTQAGTSILMSQVNNGFVVGDIFTSTMKNLTLFNGKLYFSGAEGGVGVEMFSVPLSGGNGAIVANISGGVSNSDPANLTLFNDQLYFSAGSAGINNLWRTDGTTPGTVMVNTHSISESGDPDMIVFNNLLYYRADGGDGAGNELWKINGAGTATRVTNLNPGAGDAFIDTFSVGFEVFNNELYFGADDGTIGIELYKINAGDGVSLVKDINPGGPVSWSTPRFFAELNGELFFSATDGTTGFELWSSDGTTAGTALVKDINPGPANSFPLQITAFDGGLVFAATTPATGFELWSSDGTTAGTLLAADIIPGPLGSLPVGFTVFNPLFFFASDAAGNSFIYRVDETPAPTPGKEPYTRDADDPFDTDLDAAYKNYQQYKAAYAALRAGVASMDVVPLIDVPAGLFSADVAVDHGDAAGVEYNAAWDDAGTLYISYDSLAYNPNEGIVLRGAAAVQIPPSEIAGGNNPETTYTVNIVCTEGDVTLSGTEGLVFVDGDGTADPAMQFIGDLSDINVALEAMRVQYPVEATKTVDVSIMDSGYVAAGVYSIDPARDDRAAVTLDLADILDAVPSEKLPRAIIITLTSDYTGETDLSTTVTKVVRIAFNPEIRFPETELEYRHGVGPLFIATDAEFSDLDSETFDGGTVYVDYYDPLGNETGTDFDQLAVEGSFKLQVQGYRVISNGEVVAFLQGGYDGEGLTLTFTEHSTPDDVTRLIRSITYSNTAETPASHTRVVRFAVVDPDGGSHQDYKFLAISEGLAFRPMTEVEPLDD